MLKLGVLKEPEDETRVSLIPEIVVTLLKSNISILIEKEAGLKSSYSNESYQKAGGVICSRKEVLDQADIICTINAPTDEEIKSINKKILIGVFHPLFQAAKLKKWVDCGVVIFSLDMLPRTSRAQSMDVLSSQANIAGYKAVLLAANLYPRYFPMFMTAAGSIPPAKVLILGAGVAGLQAIATARRLGAVVEVFDTRPSVKEQVMSLGAKFVEVEGAADATKAGGYAVEQSEDFKQKQKQKIAEHTAKADIIITTAQIPGKPAPILLTGEMIEAMKPGSVIIDLAASTGGNTEFTKDKETIIKNKVAIVGNSALPSTMPADASKMYSKNIQNFLKLIIQKEGLLNLNFEDDLVSGCCIAFDGKITNERISQLLD